MGDTGYTGPWGGAGLPSEEPSPITFQGLDLSVLALQWSNVGVRLWTAEWRTPLLYSWPWFGRENQAKPSRAEGAFVSVCVRAADLFSPIRDWRLRSILEVSSRAEALLTPIENAVFPGDLSEILRASNGYLGLELSPAWKLWRWTLRFSHVSAGAVPDHAPLSVDAALVPWGARR